MAVKALVFDVGGVLQTTVDRAPRQAWEARLGLPAGGLEAAVFSSDVGTAAQRGDITTDALWQAMGRRFALDANALADLRRDFWRGDAIDQTLIALIERHRPQYQTAIISNASDNLRHVLRDFYRIAHVFDLVVVSAEERVMKPDAQIYERTLARLGRRAAETVFVDDAAANVAAARQLGMHAVHYTPGINAGDAFTQLGVHPAGRPDAD